MLIATYKKCIPEANPRFICKYVWELGLEEHTITIRSVGRGLEAYNGTAPDLLDVKFSSDRWFFFIGQLCIRRRGSLAFH